MGHQSVGDNHPTKEDIYSCLGWSKVLLIKSIQILVKHSVDIVCESNCKYHFENKIHGGLTARKYFTNITKTCDL